jgi:hypothetical protein
MIISQTNIPTIDEDLKVKQSNDCIALTEDISFSSRENYRIIETLYLHLLSVMQTKRATVKVQ